MNSDFTTVSKQLGADVLKHSHKFTFCHIVGEFAVAVCAWKGERERGAGGVEKGTERVREISLVQTISPERVGKE